MATGYDFSVYIIYGHCAISCIGHHRGAKTKPYRGCTEIVQRLCDDRADIIRSYDFCTMLFCSPVEEKNCTLAAWSAQGLRTMTLRSYHATYDVFKGEVRSWSNLISEERVKFSEQNSENLMKIGWKIRKLWNFEVSQIFRKHFLTSLYEYANEWVDDVIASLLAIYFVHKVLKILIFAPTFDSYVPHIKIYWC